MNIHRVALLPIDSYDQPLVDAAVQKGIALLGGLEGLVQREEHILIKPNLLGKAAPEKAMTTHPAVFEAVAGLLLREGYAHLSYGDSPANPATTPAHSANACGIAEAAERLGIPMANFNAGSTVPFEAGKVSKSFYLCQGVQDADAIINVCKMKTHALERITGAVKNLYGCIWSLNKGAGHVSYPNSEVFADMLVDLNRCLQPRLHIMDGIVAMEGNGPSSGVPRPMNVLLFSTDPVALDAVYAALVHLDPASVPTCVCGERQGLGTMTLSQLEVATPDGVLSVADAVARYGCSDFDVYRGALGKHTLGRLAMLLPFLQARPQVQKDKCIACGVCERVCPVPGKAVHSGHGQKATYDYKKCIRCFCCQEMCPAKAIDVHRNPIAQRLARHR